VESFYELIDPFSGLPIRPPPDSFCQVFSTQFGACLAHEVAAGGAGLEIPALSSLFAFLHLFFF